MEKLTYKFLLGTGRSNFRGGKGEQGGSACPHVGLPLGEAAGGLVPPGGACARAGRWGRRGADAKAGHKAV